MTVVARFFAVLLLALAISPLAHAQDAEAVKALLAELQAATKAKDDSALSTAVAKVPALFNAGEDKALRGKLASALGKVLKAKGLDAAQTATLTALVELDDKKLAWKQMSKVMPNPKKVEEATEFQIAVVSAAGALGQKSALAPLLEIAAKAKDDKLAAASARSLGGFKEDPKLRVTAFEELISIGLRTRPGRSTSKQVSPEAQARWQDVGAGIVEALNALTGRTERDFETYEELYKDHKSKLDEIFPE